ALWFFVGVLDFVVYFIAFGWTHWQTTERPSWHSQRNAYIKNHGKDRICCTIFLIHSIMDYKFVLGKGSTKM
ncbi:MAG: hypothetical protein JWM44_1678, partial [Bacilli bacterium]|nr:hypothetical protein [Bacilli bacterium]